MTYVSLVHQIKQAKLVCYTDKEITNAVISSMSPSLTLRNVLETASSLSLERLEQFFEVDNQ